MVNTKRDLLDEVIQEVKTKLSEKYYVRVHNEKGLEVGVLCMNATSTAMLTLGLTSSLSTNEGDKLDLAMEVVSASDEILNDEFFDFVENLALEAGYLSVIILGEESDLVTCLQRRGYDYNLLGLRGNLYGYIKELANNGVKGQYV